ncbi:MAG: beta-lactamase family protein [Kangiellaceae bacterium]|nr:beta-lactamase family protein [Kangiellaceae bacterium]MCW8998174.1 beta-lactamase family protein [Kangiellaceae bacterium]MCW9017238.1 beta-lactamase family protein [Kangiellaceae bacterium]
MMNVIRRYFEIFLVIAIGLSSGCGGSSDNAPQQQLPTYQYSPPEDLGDGWQVGDLNAKGIDPASLETLINNIQNNAAGYLYIDSIAIAKNGELLLNHRTRTSLDQADGWANNQNIELHVLNSVTKSFTSALIGIAIDRGEIDGVNVLVHDYFQHKLPISNWTESKSNITLENWLNMRSGYEWDEWNVNYLDSNNLNMQMNNSSDPIQFLLDRPMTTEPGTTFAYSTGITFGLGRIIQLASGLSVANYLDTYLLTPLNISQFDYWSLDGQLHTGSALYLTTRDMIKFGQLYLDDGVWNGQRIISESWVNQSTQLRVQLSETGGYGYQWWMTQFDVNGQSYATYYANGFGGQYIFVFPELDLVVGLTGRAYADGQGEGRDIRGIMENDILPSFIN